MKAFVSVTFDDMFVVHDMKIVEGKQGLFLAMPSKRTANGKFKDVAHPINAKSRYYIQKAVFEKFIEEYPEKIDIIKKLKKTLESGKISEEVYEE